MSFNCGKLNFVIPVINIFTFLIWRSFWFYFSEGAPHISSWSFTERILFAQSNRKFKLFKIFVWIYPNNNSTGIIYGLDFIKSDFSIYHVIYKTRKRNLCKHQHSPVNKSRWHLYCKAQNDPNGSRIDLSFKILFPAEDVIFVWFHCYFDFCFFLMLFYRTNSV